MLHYDKFLEMSFDEKAEYIEKRLTRLCELKEIPFGTKTADELWKSRLVFYIEFFKKLANQLKMSNSVIVD
jgi:uncharacterized protein